MTSYILLALLITIIVIGIVRASKQPKTNRRRPRSDNISMRSSSVQNRTPHSSLTHETTASRITPAQVEHSAYFDEYDEEETEEYDENDEAEYENEDEDAHDDHYADFDEDKTEDDEDEELEQEEAQQPHNTPAATPIKNEIITITLRAEDGKPYKGYELLQALLTSGMRYSRQGIFNRYTKLIKRDEVLFSLVSGVAPGTFDLPKMGSFSSPALTLFMQTGDVENPGETYNLMLGTARDLIETLGGDLLDETKMPLTAEKISYWQHRLKNMVAA